MIRKNINVNFVDGSIFRWFSCICIIDMIIVPRRKDSVTQLVNFVPKYLQAQQ